MNRLVTRPLRWSLVVFVAATAAVPAFAQATSRRDVAATFALGDSRERVREVQGKPGLVERLPSLGVETWSYGGAEVTFTTGPGGVIAWRDDGAGERDRTLRVRLRAGGDTTAARTMSLGASLDDVVRLHGTPWRIVRDRRAGSEYWSYGASTIRLALETSRVSGWWNTGGTLRVSAEDDALARVAVAAPPRAPTRAPVARPSAPASLSATVTLREPSGNGAIDATERATIALTIHNAGPGEARALRPTVRSEGSTPALRLGAPDEIPVLAPGASITILTSVQGTPELTDGSATLIAAVREGNGFDLSPALRLSVTTRAALAPRFALAGMRVEDQSGDGRLTPREIAEVTVRIANDGPGIAHVAEARLDLGANVFVTRESPERYSLGTLAPGATVDLSFSLYTNSRATSIPVAVTVTAGAPATPTRLPLALAFDAAVAQTLDAPLRTDVATAPARGAPLDGGDGRALPRAAAANPDALAIVLGVERYRTLPAARFAATDARLAARDMAAAFGIPDDRAHMYVRTDADATGSEFRKLFADDGWLARRVRQNTDVVVFFAGHGAPDLKARTPILMPFDGDASYARETGYALGTLFEQLAKLEARSITVFVDACFSGLTRSSAPLLAGTRGIVVSVEHPALARENMAVFLAARGDQTAGALTEKRHGLFTWFAMQGLRGAADADGDRAITVTELEGYLGAQVPRSAALHDREQQPLVIARDRSRVLVRLGATP